MAMLISFSIFFVLFASVGIVSYFWKKSTIDDYFLASREIPAWLVGLSYGATISSGATFIGFAGLAYHSPIIALVSTMTLTLGDYAGWRIAGDRVRARATARQAHTYPSFLGKIGMGEEYKGVTFIAAFISILSMGGYCAAQLMAGAKIGQALFGWDYHIFIFVGAAVLLSYCWAGGIRASIWTDAVQALVIVASLILLIITGLAEVGGFPALMQGLRDIDPALVDWRQWSLVPLGIGWFTFGLGVLGQPQLMVRHMVARSERDIITARRIYFSWRVFVLLLACASGMIARLMIPAGQGFDPELSIPALWDSLLPPVLVGFLIAGMFSATMSTADSLLLSASSALTQHILPRWRDSYALARLGTVVVIIFVVLVAMFAGKGVLALVILAWGGLASAVAPYVVLRILGVSIAERTSMAMMVGGFLVTVIWRYGFGWHNILMDTVPGMATGFLIFLAARFLPVFSHRKTLD